MRLAASTNLRNCRRFFCSKGAPTLRGRAGDQSPKKEVSAIAAQEPRLNEEIAIRECRLIDFDGNQMGVFSIEQAQSIADAAGLDLVEIAPNADPPVCRIMDYGKFKEMKFRPKIDVGDYQTKKKHVLRFLSAGNKVKITIMFRGREMVHPEQGLSIPERLADDLKDIAAIENQPKMEGRNMHMLIAPLPQNAKKKESKGGKDDASKPADAPSGDDAE